MPPPTLCPCNSNSNSGQQPPTCHSQCHRVVSSRLVACETTLVLPAPTPTPTRGTAGRGMRCRRTDVHMLVPYVRTPRLVREGVFLHPSETGKTWDNKVCRAEVALSPRKRPRLVSLRPPAGGDRGGRNEDRFTPLPQHTFLTVLSRPRLQDVNLPGRLLRASSGSDRVCRAGIIMRMYVSQSSDRSTCLLVVRLACLLSAPDCSSPIHLDLDRGQAGNLAARATGDDDVMSE
ncbi:hypothetical protein K402DRAFT_185113 [Aulographum hederae CBS 113979]|uniref:Uncharacterized protein n=1 Tax=Aulographum hederae CBS 113979 TaxID=1176131 RepID=A0A6G1GPT8_9PEZI|nr:hypothetical protein K402DRAFT_185113 [Aulographum hederae CBS 113979]